MLEAVEKQTPVLAGRPTSEDFLRVMRRQHAASRQLDQIGGRIADTLQEMKLNQVGSPKSHRLLQQGIIEPIKALNAGPMGELRGMLQSLAERRHRGRGQRGGRPPPARPGRRQDEGHPRADVAVGELR